LFDPLSSSHQRPNLANPVQATMQSHSSPSPNLQPMSPEQLQYLQNQGFSTGMIRAFHIQKESFPLRVWILDNSAAMSVRDAHIVRVNHQQTIDNVTRWDELKDCLFFHTDLTARFLLPTRFALLNAPQSGLPQYFSLAQAGNLMQEQQIVQKILTHAFPNGATPISAQLQILHGYITSIAPQLFSKQHTVPIVVTTQGLPTSATGETSSDVINGFFRILESFEQLPVSIVLRLCTDDEKAIDFYNSMDKRLKVDVLDDFYGEALETFLRNPWLTYGLSLHRYREMGLHVRVLDILDERALTMHELKELCYFLFDTTVPDPVSDWNTFINAIGGCLSREQMQWNPIKKAYTPWIDIALLTDIYGPKQYRGSYQGQPFNQNASGNFATSSTATNSPPLQQHNLSSSATVIPPPQPPPNSTTLVTAVHSNWAKQPPNFATTKPLEELLSTIDSTFKLVPNHEYFSNKFQPFSSTALSSGSVDVLKRAVRKMRFFLHPDRLPKDFNEQQSILCRTLWDVISESWDELNIESK
jgi:hypothetical protein